MTTNVSNPNFQSPNAYQLAFKRFPNVQLFAQRITLPSFTLNPVRVSTNNYFDYYTAGDKIEFDDIIVSLLVDEDMRGYKEIKDWLFDIASSENKQELFSDFTILLLTNNKNSNRMIQVYNAFPYYASNLLMDVASTEDTPLTIDLTFKYSHFDIKTNT